MSNLHICGGRALSGDIVPSANKNAVLPVLCATLLSSEEIVLSGVPDITDVRKILAFFREIGSSVEADFDTGRIVLRHGPEVSLHGAKLPQGMRSSVMLVPALLHRFGVVKIEDDVKGCSLGAREIDPHIDVFKLFQARVATDKDSIVVFHDGVPQAARHWLEYASVTTTENFVMLASLAKGRSELVNAASEPHVQEFCAFLKLLGAKIEGDGTSKIAIEGVEALGGGEFTFTEDFHEVTTLLAIGAITGGTVRVKNSNPNHFPLIDRTFTKFGVSVSHENGWTSAHCPGGLVVQQPFTQYMMPKVEAAPWPYIPADLLPIFIALGVKSSGSMMYWNKVYEGAFGWAPELAKFGAHTILCDPHRLITFGGKRLFPAKIEAPYIIRVALALFMIASSIPGDSVILNADPIKRAHPHFAEKINSLGAHVAWENV